MTKKRTQLGKLSRKHTFFLNPYENARFTRCPKCEGKTRVRKFPFVIHIDPMTLLTLNMSGPYCPACDLIILHKDRVETLLTATFQQHNPSIIGNDYLIIGTVEHALWLKTTKRTTTIQETFDNLHDFKQVVTFEPAHYGWLPNPSARKDTP
jgi:hypothetical protein